MIFHPEHPPDASCFEQEVVTKYCSKNNKWIKTDLIIKTIQIKLTGDYSEI
jgi:hypothetical protein